MMKQKWNGILLAFIVLLFPLLMISIYPVHASGEYTISTPIEDIGIYKDIFLEENRDCRSFIKFNTTTIPSARTISSATLFIRVDDGETHTVWGSYVSNQTWTEDDSGIDLGGIAAGTNDILLGSTVLNKWVTYDVKLLFQIHYQKSDVNFTLDFYETGRKPSVGDEDWTVINDYLRTGDFPLAYLDWYSKELGSIPYLEITLASIPAGSWTISYDFPTFADQTSFPVPETHWNTTKLLYRVFLYPYEDLTNVTIQGIDTSYSFAHIYPNATDYSDTISSDGQIIFYDLYESVYEVVIDPSQDWHTLHISMYAPDGVGLMWESFQIYINYTRVPYPPNYQIETGYYEYAVKDYFSQTVLSGDFTIYTSDPEDIYQNWEVPVYEVSFHNGDEAPYNVEITRNAQTRIWPTPPNGDSAGIRLYGLAANVEYDIVIRDTNTGEVRDSYPLLVANAPIGRALDYVPDDPSPGGASQNVIVDFLPWTAVILIGFFLIGDFNHRRSQKGQDRVTWRQQYLLRHGVKTEKELSAYERRKMQEAEDARFGKRRFKRRDKK